MNPSEKFGWGHVKFVISGALGLIVGAIIIAVFWPIAMLTYWITELFGGNE